MSVQVGPGISISIHVTSDTDGLASKAWVEEMIKDVVSPDEKDPTVYAWAKQPEKPTYTAAEVGAQPAGDYALKSDIPNVPSKLSELSDDTEHRLSTDAEKAVWNAKSDFSGKYGDLEGKPDIPVVPTDVSAFTNDAGYLTEHQDLSDYALKSDIPDTSAFITRAVNDLENYYRKSETYTRDEIDGRISAIPKFSIDVVYVLPTDDISETTIYLVASGSDNDLYTEYIYVNGSWEVLGSQRVDLTGYATQSWTLEQLAGKLDASALPEGASANQMLVTDAEGEAKWEDKSRLVETTIETVYDSTIETVANEYNDYASASIDYNARDYDSSTAIIIFDGVTYVCPRQDFYYSTTVWGYGNAIVGGFGGNNIEDTGEPFFWYYYGGSSIATTTPGTHTFTVVTKKIPSGYLPKPIPSEYFPVANVPVLDYSYGCLVGQTPVINAVDNNGSPTYWSMATPVVERDLFDSSPKYDLAIGKDKNGHIVTRFVMNGTLPNSAFASSKITEVSLPIALKNINGYAFFNCTNLASISFPSGLTTIGGNIFRGCTRLTEVTFNGAPTSIASTAFYGCTNLTTINVPWAEGEVANAPWGATNATINYNYTAPAEE